MSSRELEILLDKLLKQSRDLTGALGVSQVESLKQTVEDKLQLKQVIDGELKKLQINARLANQSITKNEDLISKLDNRIKQIDLKSAINSKALSRFDEVDSELVALRSEQQDVIKNIESSQQSLSLHVTDLLEEVNGRINDLPMLDQILESIEPKYIPHAMQHLPGGSDIIPAANEDRSGLMTPSMVSRLSYVHEIITKKMLGGVSSGQGGGGSTSSTPSGAAWDELTGGGETTLHSHPNKIPMSTDPDAPTTNGSILWHSDGTESGDFGDLMIKTNFDGMVIIATLWDASDYFSMFEQEGGSGMICTEGKANCLTYEGAVSGMAINPTHLIGE